MKKSIILSGISVLTLAVTPVALAKEVTIKEGDTLSKLAEENNTTVEMLAAINDITNPDLIYAGEKLYTDPADVPNKDLSAPTPSVTPAPQETYQAPAVSPAAPAPTYTAGGSVTLPNGNTAGAVGSAAAAEMARRTGVPASTWEHIIARESNCQVNAYNPSGASGLFQTMPGWGPTGTVEQQLDAATRAYQSQGLSAWGY